MNVGQAHLSGQMSGQAAQMNQVGGGGASNGVIGGADGMPQQMQMQDNNAAGLGNGMDPHFVLMRNNMREKIYEYIGRKQTSADWRRRLPELSKRLEEILFRKFPSKNEYFTMMKAPVEPQLQFAIKTLSAQNQQNQQNQQMSRQMASSSGYGTMIPTPGITQGAGGNSRMSYVTDNMGLSSSGAGMVPQNTNMGNSMPGSMSNGYQHLTTSAPLNSTTNNASSTMGQMGIQRQVTHMIPTPGFSNQQNVPGNSDYSNGTGYFNGDSAMTPHMQQQQQQKQFPSNQSSHQIQHIGGNSNSAIHSSMLENSSAFGLSDGHVNPLPFGKSFYYMDELISDNDQTNHYFLQHEEPARGGSDFEPSCTSITTSNPFVPFTSHDGTSIAMSNSFVQTDLLLSSTSHHVPSSLERILHDQSSRPRDIPLQYLKQITDNFSDKRILGEGGSGVVYKGVLPNGEMIAVKKIVSAFMPGLQKQFENEVYHLMMLKHPNIVRCVGYCYETRHECLEYNGKLVFAEMAERLLCLEYIPNRSLDKYITDESSGLDWSTRYKIIVGVFYGLCHLHDQNGKPIIHLDLKPANILLDDGMTPKITDFGLSRLLDQEKTIYTKSRYGTLGYMAPEFLHGGTITPKSDIFSLGVIIIEVVTGHRDYPDVTRTSSDGFIKLVLNKWRNVLEKSSWFGSVEKDCQQIERCIQVGLICVNHDRTKRPPIAKIINMIQGLESINCDTSIEAA